MSERQTEKEPLYYQAYSLIKQGIMEGKYEPGERLTDARVAQEINISRTPVREAIKQLVQEGLLINLPNKGVSVFNPTEKDVAEIFILRASLEGVAAGLAAANEGRKAYLYYMLEKIEESEVAAKENNITLLTENNIQFHDLFIKASESTRLIENLETLRMKSYLIRSYSLSKKENYVTSIKEHKEIFEMIKNGESVKVEKFVRNHILAAGLRNVLAFGNTSEDDPLMNYYMAREEEIR